MISSINWFRLWRETNFDAIDSVAPPWPEQLADLIGPETPMRDLIGAQHTAPLDPSSWLTPEYDSEHFQ